MTDLKKIENYLEKQEVRHSNLGYKYLITAIVVGLEAPLLCMRISDLYQKVAEVHNAKQSSVERSIRYLLADKNITNKEFIMKAIDTLEISLKTMQA